MGGLTPLESANATNRCGLGWGFFFVFGGLGGDLVVKHLPAHHWLFSGPSHPDVVVLVLLTTPS